MLNFSALYSVDKERDSYKSTDLHILLHRLEIMSATGEALKDLIELILKATNKDDSTGEGGEHKYQKANKPRDG